MGLEDKVNELKQAASTEEARAASREAELKAACRRELEAAGREALAYLRGRQAPTHVIGVEKRRVLGSGTTFSPEGRGWVISGEHGIALTDRGELVRTSPVEGRQPRLRRAAGGLEEFLRYYAQLDEVAYGFPTNETYLGSDLKFRVDSFGTRVDGVSLTDWLARTLASR